MLNSYLKTLMMAYCHKLDCWTIPWILSIITGAFSTTAFLNVGVSKKMGCWKTLIGRDPIFQKHKIFVNVM